MWFVCIQEEAHLSLVEGKQENEENVPNAYSAHVKNKGGNKKFKGPKEIHGKIDLSKIECYHCHKMGHYKNQCPDNPKNKKRERDQATIATDDNPQKKSKSEDPKVNDLFY